MIITLNSKWVTGPIRRVAKAAKAIVASQRTTTTVEHNVDVIKLVNDRVSRLEQRLDSLNECSICQGNIYCNNEAFEDCQYNPNNACATPDEPDF